MSQPIAQTAPNRLCGLNQPGVKASAAQTPSWIEDATGPKAADLVACRNGLLHLPSGELLPPVPSYFNLNAVPFAYQEDAGMPTAWIGFLRQIWSDDPEAIEALQEVFGYLLTPDTSQQKIFLLQGPKRAGKGTIARVLTEVLGGCANVANPTLDGLAGTFGLQGLVGKLAAVVSDARLGTRTDQKAVAENLLRISGEDAVEVGRKFLPPVTLRLGVRFLLLTNEIPRIADASGAMASRFVIITMKQSFFGREDPGLTSKLLAELPGILKWAVEGWRRLRTRGYFIEPKSSSFAAQDLAELGSPISTFVRDACEVDPAAEVPQDTLYVAWRAWCATEGIEHPGVKTVFGRDLRASLPNLGQAQRRIGSGERVRVYCGIRSKPGTRWHAFQHTVEPPRN